jgi:hypothetical protein
LCAPLGVISSANGRVDATRLKLPLVPITQTAAIKLLSDGNQDADEGSCIDP